MSRWIVTIEIPNKITGRSHTHVDVDAPMEASAVIQAVQRSLGVVAPAHVEEWSREWKCARCSQWRMEQLVIGDKFESKEK